MNIEDKARADVVESLIQDILSNIQYLQECDSLPMWVVMELAAASEKIDDITFCLKYDEDDRTSHN